MTGWVLLMMVCWGMACNGHQVPMFAVYGSKEACENAAAHAEKVFGGTISTVYHTCDPQ